MVSFKNIVLLACTATALVVERSPTDVLNKLKSVDTTVKGLTSDVKAWDGSLTGAVTIQDQEGRVEDAVKAATKQAKGESQTSSADSKKILKYVTGTLSPDVKSALDAVVKRKADFEKSKTAGLVQNDLDSLKTDTDALGAALKKIASNDQKTPAQNAINTINKYFSSAIAAFA